MAKKIKKAKRAKKAKSLWKFGELEKAMTSDDDVILYLSVCLSVYLSDYLKLLLEAG